MRLERTIKTKQNTDILKIRYVSTNNQKETDLNGKEELLTDLSILASFEELPTWPFLNTKASHGEVDAKIKEKRSRNAGIFWNRAIVFLFFAIDWVCWKRIESLEWYKSFSKETSSSLVVLDTSSQDSFTRIFLWFLKIELGEVVSLLLESEQEEEVLKLFFLSTWSCWWISVAFNASTITTSASSLFTILFAGMVAEDDLATPMHSAFSRMSSWSFLSSALLWRMILSYRWIG